MLFRSTGFYSFTNTDTAIKNIKYDGSDTFTFKDTDDSDNAKLTIDANGIRTSMNTIDNEFTLLNTNTSSVASSALLTSPDALRFTLLSDNNTSNNDGLMLLVSTNDFSFLTNTDYDASTEALRWGSGQMLRMSTTGCWLNDSLRIGGTSTKTPTAKIGRAHV